MQKEPDNNVFGLKSLELLEETYQLSDEQKAELSALYEDVFKRFQIGKIIKGQFISKDSGGILIDVSYKSNGYVPAYEFSEYEFKKLLLDSEIEVLLDRLEDENGNVVLSYQKAKSLKAWEDSGR